MKKQELIDYFNSLNYSGFKEFYLKYADYLYPERVDQDLKEFPSAKGTIVPFIFDCTDDNFNRGVYGSLELIVEITDNNDTSIDTLLHQFRVTVDPCRNKQGIAHLARQIYTGNVGLHRGDSNRLCIRSDKEGTWFRRTNTAGDFIKLEDGHIVAEREIGINNHDSGGYYDSSLGCIILFGGGWQDKNSVYSREFKPLIKRCTNPNNIPMVIAALEDAEDIINWKISA